MKLSKEELIQKINEKVMDEDVKIELMEDITDSFEVTEEKSDEVDERVKELEEKYKNLQEKYKERFLSGTEEKEEIEEKEDDEELKEEEVIDVKEI